MVNHNRRKRLLKLLAEHEEASVAQLVTWLNASPATVRRDLSWLATRNLLTRTRGGAANLCVDGETIIINGGTTTYMMVEFLADKHLKILTNSFLMAERLLVSSENEIILPGGKVYREQNVILSPFDNDITQHHYAAKMFMGVYGLSLLGLMEADPLLIQAEKRLISQAEELIVLADSSKFAKKAGLILCGLNRVSCVITDTGVSDSAVQLLEQSGVNVITVEPESLPAHPCDLSHNRALYMDNAAMYEPETVA
jgi:DeoR family ulaG and ulaABCDEF operon transcriptional repressor